MRLSHTTILCLCAVLGVTLLTCASRPHVLAPDPAQALLSVDGRRHAEELGAYASPEASFPALPWAGAATAEAEAQCSVAAGASEPADTTAAQAPWPRTWWRSAGVDHGTLAALLGEKGFRGSRSFRIFVLEVTLDETRTRIVSERAFDWADRSSRNYGWNVGSSVKLFAAAGALARLRARGFGPDAWVLFDGRSPAVASVRELVESAIVDSDNMAYNRLVQLAGCDWLNEQFLTAEHGIVDSAISEAYDQRKWRRFRERADLRYAPPIIIEEQDLTLELPASRGESRPACGGAACTNLRDLAEGMRRIALHEVLPPDERLPLETDDLAVLRNALAAPRERGENVVEALRAAFGDQPVMLYHKPGYSERWFSDVVYVHPEGGQQVWVIAITARRGRRGLDRPSRLLGRALASGALARAQAAPEPIEAQPASTDELLAGDVSRAGE